MKSCSGSVKVMWEGLISPLLCVTGKLNFDMLVCCSSARLLPKIM